MKLFVNWHNPYPLICVDRSERLDAMNTGVRERVRGQVHCPMCTHAVMADVDMAGKRPRVVPGQKCPRCNAKLDAAWVLQVPVAA